MLPTYYLWLLPTLLASKLLGGAAMSPIHATAFAISVDNIRQDQFRFVAILLQFRDITVTVMR